MSTLLVQSYMTRPPWSIGQHQSLADAHALMRAHAIRHLPVLHGGQLVGVVLLGDLHLVEALERLQLDRVPVAEAMSTDVYVVGPAMPVAEVARVMAERKLGSAVVVEGHEVVGIFTATDALRALSALAARSGWHGGPPHTA